MARRRKLNRRRGDDRVATKPDYALIQNAADAFDDELAIPSFDAPVGDVESLDIQAPEAEFSEFAELDALQIPSETAELELNTDSLLPAPTFGPADSNASRIFALVGATGGVGTTSLATQLAHEFAQQLAMSSKQVTHRRPSDPKVCLIDLDFESGSCAHHLDLLPSLSLEDLCGPADHIDTAFTQALVSTHECGVSLLAAPNTIGANARINPHNVMAMLDAAAELYDTVIIDMPRYRQPWTLSVMRAVDVLGITCELTIPSLHATRERLARLAHDANGGVNAEIILSKFERRSFKNTLRLSDAETALGRSVMSTLSLDPDTTREALNCGEPAGAIRPDSRFVKDVRKLAISLREQQSNVLAKVA